MVALRCLLWILQFFLKRLFLILTLKLNNLLFMLILLSFILLGQMNFLWTNNIFTLMLFLRLLRSLIFKFVLKFNLSFKCTKELIVLISLILLSDRKFSERLMLWHFYLRVLIILLIKSLKSLIAGIVIINIVTRKILPIWLIILII